MSDFEHHFQAEIVEYGTGKVSFTAVFVPDSITSKLDFPKSKRLRINGEINGALFELALMPSKGKWFILVSRKLRKLCGIALGETASVSFDVADQDAVNVPIELQHALEANEAAYDAWRKLTAGKQRGLAYRVETAKRPETRERRVEETLDLLLGNPGL